MTTKHVCNKFPNHIDAIQVLFKKDTAFREICNDYEETCNWLEDYCRSKGQPSAECDHAQQLIRELEDEIIKVLEERL